MAEPTLEELTARQDAAARELSAAHSEVEQAQERYNAAVVAGENEIAMSRARKALDDAKAKVAALEERAGILAGAIENAFEAQAADLRQEQIRKAGALLEERAREFRTLEAALVTVATSITKLAQLSLDSIAALPKRPQWTPPMFIPSSFERLVAVRLMVLTDGKLVPPHGRVTLHEAQQWPTLAARAAKERAEILEQYGVPPTPNKNGSAARIKA